MRSAQDEVLRRLKRWAVDGLEYATKAGGPESEYGVCGQLAVLTVVKGLSDY